MTAQLTRLVDAARQLAGQDGTFYSGRIWQFEAGRACPIGWVDCSKAVHPGKGGSTAAMAEFNQARDDALKEIQ